jgi:hypothetical protein
MEKDVKRYLEMARGYLEDCDGKTPQEKLNAVGLLFGLAQRKGVTDGRYNEGFWDYVNGTGFSERLATKNDIDFADGLLREFIGELEGM